MNLLAVVRVRGRWKVPGKISHTLSLLRLHKPNHCSIWPDSPSVKGMLQKVSAWTTFGPISKGTLASLLWKRGEIGSRFLRETMSEEETRELAAQVFERGPAILAERGISPVFRLRPPRKGWGRVKRYYSEGGALGPRPEMDTLLRRMM